jgi:hypothetical protein
MRDNGASEVAHKRMPHPSNVLEGERIVESVPSPHLANQPFPYD